MLWMDHGGLSRRLRFREMQQLLEPSRASVHPKAQGLRCNASATSVDQAKTSTLRTYLSTRIISLESLDPLGHLFQVSIFQAFERRCDAFEVLSSGGLYGRDDRYIQDDHEPQHV
jgi:hypothetical protein